MKNSSGFESFFKVLGIIIAVIGLIICFTGVGAIAGIPMLTIGGWIGNLGQAMGENPKGCGIAVIVVILLLLVFMLQNC